MHLLLVEVLHFMRCYYLIIVEVDDLKPIVNAANSRLIFLAKHEPDKVFIVHFILSCTFEFTGHLIEYSIHCLT